MSLKTWKAEFYPTEANTVQSDLEAVKHSLQKWQGLTTENLAKHELGKEHSLTLTDNEGDGFDVNSTTCALCQMHQDPDNSDNTICDECPLAESRDGTPCDHTWKNHEEVSPYLSFLRDEPQPMIELLQLTLDRLRE